MTEFSKLSEALKGNRNAAKDYIKKGVNSIETISKNTTVTAGKVFADSKEKITNKININKERINDQWESIDKTVKYAAVGTVVGAASGAVGIKTTNMALKAIKTPANAAKLYGSAGVIAGTIAGGLDSNYDPKTMAISAGIIGATGAAAGATGFKLAQTVSKINPAVRIGASAIVGGVYGGFIGNQIDKIEKVEKKNKKL